MITTSTSSLTIHQQIAAAKAGADAWAATSMSERLAILRKLRHTLADNALPIARQITAELPQRLDVAQTLASELLPLLAAIKFVEQNATALLAPRHLGSRGRPIWLWGAKSTIHRDPKGVVLIIAPFNYPFMLAGVTMVQALAAGNAVLIKPGRLGQQCIASLVKHAHEAGVPVETLQVLDNSVQTGLDTIDSGHVNHVVMTGSTDAGKAIMVQCAKKLIPCTLELSGSDAVFVLPSANLAHVCKAMRFGLTLNSGATCIAPRRLYVHTSKHDELCQQLTRTLQDTPALPADATAVARLRTLVDSSLRRGATQWTGGVDRHNHVTPVLLSGVQQGDAILAADVFAPVLSVIRVDSMDEALVLNQQCPYALAASVFGDATEASAMAELIDAGTVTVNDLIFLTADPRLPFGGRRNSGLGVTRGSEGLLELTQPRTVVQQPSRLQMHLQPPRVHDDRRLACLIRASHCRGWTQRLTAIMELIGLK